MVNSSKLPEKASRLRRRKRACQSGQKEVIAGIPWSKISDEKATRPDFSD